MVIKKDLIIAVLATFCLTATLFSIIPTKSSPDSGEYDPWVDITDDGKIDGKDIALVSKLFGTLGTPINKTALLLELQARIDNLNASLLDLEAYLETRMTTLETSLVALEARICELEILIEILNATKLGKPDYDSNWTSINPNSYVIFEHNLNTTHVLVYMIGKYSDSASPYIHQIDYGGEWCTTTHTGAWWCDLTNMTIRVHRRDNDAGWNYVRVLIWKLS